MVSSVTNRRIVVPAALSPMMSSWSEASRETAKLTVEPSLSPATRYSAEAVVVRFIQKFPVTFYCF